MMKHNRSLYVSLIALIILILLNSQFHGKMLSSSFAVVSKDEEELIASMQQNKDYIPAPMEQWIMNNLHSLGWEESATNPDSCSIFHNKTCEIYSELQQYIQDLTDYHTAVEKFQGFHASQTDYTDLRFVPKDKCDMVRLHPEKGDLENMFHGQLSKTSKGVVEPLLTPMRHPMFCYNRGRAMDMKYMVHDFEAICRDIKPNARTVLIDMGASLDFHHDDVPIFYLLGLYKKFGITFDHIYAFEMVKKDPETVYKAVPDNLMTSYHWINVGVSPEVGNKLNPLQSILHQFNKDGKMHYLFLCS
jgi:hypothetical protein